MTRPGKCVNSQFSMGLLVWIAVVGLWRPTQARAGNTSPAIGQKPPSIVLISIDTLRARSIELLRVPPHPDAAH